MVLPKYDFQHPDVNTGHTGPFTKGEKVIYRSGMGGLYSARVMIAHRDGEVTLKVMFPLRKDLTEMSCGYIGTRYRVKPNQNISGWL